MWLGERLRLRSELHLTPPSTLQQTTQLLEQVTHRHTETQFDSCCIIFLSCSCDTYVTAIAVQVKSVGGFDSKEEMRAVLAKVGSLLAPRHFTVAIGDKAEETSQTEGDTAREKGEKEKEGKEEEEEKEGEEETETTGKDREKEYQVLKQQVQAHKMEVGSTDDVDRSAHTPALAVYIIISPLLLYPLHNRCRLWADLAKFARKYQVWDVAFVSAKFCLTYDDNRWTGEGTDVMH